MDFSSINWLAVVACVVASMITGSVWFNPTTFSLPGGKPLASQTGMTPVVRALGWV